MSFDQMVLGISIHFKWTRLHYSIYDLVGEIKEFMMLFCFKFYYREVNFIYNWFVVRFLASQDFELELDNI